MFFICVPFLNKNVKKTVSKQMKPDGYKNSNSSGIISIVKYNK